MRPIVVAPSILAADLRRIGEEVEAVDRTGAAEHAALTVAHGADAIVAGSAIFGSRDYAAAISRIRDGAPRAKMMAAL
jgi:pentose-5-phosphate-3-epimerase